MNKSTGNQSYLSYGKLRQIIHNQQIIGNLKKGNSLNISNNNLKERIVLVGVFMTIHNE